MNGVAKLLKYIICSAKCIKLIETRINTNMSDIDFDERMKRIKELKDIQKDRVKLISESS